MTQQLFTVQFVYFDDEDSEFGPWFASIKGIPRFTNIGDQGQTVQGAFESAMEALDSAMEVLAEDGEWPEDWPAKAWRCPLCGAPSDGMCPGCLAQEFAEPDDEPLGFDDGYNV